MTDFHGHSKRYLLVSDFDQTLSFHDSGHVLADLLEAFRISASASPDSPTFTWCNRAGNSPTCCCTIQTFARCARSIWWKWAGASG